MMASTNGHLEIAKLLVENGADVHAFNAASFTAFDLVLDQNWNIGILQLLFNNSGDH